MPRNRKGTEAQLTKLRNRQKQLQAQLAALEARKKAGDCKRDTRRKIIAGGAVLAHVEHDAALREMLRQVLQQFVTRTIDKAVLPEIIEPARPDAAPVPAPPSDASPAA